MDYVWGFIQPYVAAIFAALGAGGIVAIIANSIVNKVLRKNNSLLDSTYNIDRVSQGVAEKLAGKTLNIDVTAVTEKALRKTAQELDSRVEKVEDVANSHTAILIAMAKGISKLKALSEDEKKELTTSIQLLDKGYKPPLIDEVMTVQLSPINLDDKSREDQHDSGVNFGGLESK